MSVFEKAAFVGLRSILRYYILRGLNPRKVWLVHLAGATARGYPFPFKYSNIHLSWKAVLSVLSHRQQQLVRVRNSSGWLSLRTLPYNPRYRKTLFVKHTFLLQCKLPPLMLDQQVARKFLRCDSVAPNFFTSPFTRACGNLSDARWLTENQRWISLSRIFSFWNFNYFIGVGWLKISLILFSHLMFIILRQQLFHVVKILSHEIEFFSRRMNLFFTGNRKHRKQKKIFFPHFSSQHRRIEMTEIFKNKCINFYSSRRKERLRFRCWIEDKFYM